MKKNNNTKAKETKISKTTSEVKTESVKTTATEPAKKPMTATEERVNITIKDSKEKMLKFLKATAIFTGNQRDAESKNLGERLVYALEHAAKSTKAELFELVKESQDYLFNINLKTSKVAAETEKKPAAKPTLTKKAAKPQITKTDTGKAPAKAPEKPAKAEAPKKPTTKAKKPEKTEPEKPVTSKQTDKFGNLPTAVMFPKEYVVKDLGKLVLCSDKFKSMEDVAKAFNEGRHIYFLSYWNAVQIQQFKYSESYYCLPTKSFPDDLDVMEPVFYAERTKKMWCNSLYSEAMFMFFDTEVEYIESKNPYTGEDFKARVSNGMEFEIYELIEESEAK